MARRRYDPQTRELAKDLYEHRSMAMKDISAMLDVPESTLGNWSAADDWRKDGGNDKGNAFAMTCEYLMRTIHYMSRRLFLSMFPVGLPGARGDEDVDGEYDINAALPDEKLELRINRLTLAVERIAPMGSLLQTRQRIETIRELKQVCFDAVGQGVFTDDEMHVASRVVDYYLVSLTTSEKKEGAA